MAAELSSVNFTFYTVIVFQRELANFDMRNIFFKYLKNAFTYFKYTHTLMPTTTSIEK